MTYFVIILNYKIFNSNSFLGSDLHDALACFDRSIHQLLISQILLHQLVHSNGISDFLVLGKLCLLVDRDDSFQDYRFQCR